MFIEHPNLPEKAIKTAICDGRLSEECEKELNLYGIKIIKTNKNIHLADPVSFHPDMQFYYDGKGIFYCNNDTAEYLSNIKEYENDPIFINMNKVLTDKYPDDIYFNICRIGNKIICKKNNEIIESIISRGNQIKVFNIKQGYAKCSIAPIDFNAFITDDESIYKALKKEFDILLIDKGYIKLNGYDYGFIGGSCGKIDKDKICFFGDIKKHRAYNDIKAFARNYNIECISLSLDELYDYGSLIPITE